MIAALINHLWQSTLFAGAVGLLTLTVRRNGAGVRYGLWFAASVKFLIPFAVLAAAGGFAMGRLHVSLSEPPELRAAAPVIAPFAPTPATGLLAHPPQAAAASLPTLSALSHAPAPTAGVPASLAEPALLLLAVWALGLVGVLLVWARRWSRIRAALRLARPASLPAPVPVLSTPTPLEPGVVGVLRPVLIVPDGIAERLSPAEWRALLAHELCHIRRRDNLTGLVHMLVQALFWFHPLVWWLGARLVSEREQACDEAVVQDGADPRAYAEGILKVCRLYLQQPLACAAGVSGADLKQRVQRILAKRVGERLGLAKTAMLSAAATLALAAPVSAGLLASAPTAAAAKAARVLAEAVRPPGDERARTAPQGARTIAQGPQAETTTEAAARPIVLAAIESVLSPAPQVGHARARTVVGSLAQAAPDLPAAGEPAPAPAAATSGAIHPADARTQASRFVRAYAAFAPSLVTARWRTPICIQVENLPTAQAAAVWARVAYVARALGIATERAGCRPNVEIAFTRDPQKTLDEAVKRRPDVLGDLSGAGPESAVARPVQAWYLTNGGQYASAGGSDLKVLADWQTIEAPWADEGEWSRSRVAPNGPNDPGSPGGAQPPDAGPNATRQLLNALVVIDLRRTGDTKLAVLAEYAAMVALSEARPVDHCQPLPSVTDLFAGPCPGRAAPTGLTPADTAYLTALYTARPYQRRIVARMAELLAGASGAPTYSASLGRQAPGSRIPAAPTSRQ